MSVDDRIRESLRRVAATSSTDLDATRATMRSRGGPPRRTTVIALAAAAAVIAVIVVPTYLLGRTHDHAGDRLGDGVLKVDRRFSYAVLSLHHPLAVAAAPDGSFYVSDASDRISHYSPSGRLLSRWGSRGAVPGQLRLVSGAMAVGPDDRVYVADTGNSRIDVFTSDGRFVTSYGSFGRLLGHYLWPTDVALDSRGDIYVGDQRRAGITMLDPHGAPVLRVGHKSAAHITAAVHLGETGPNGEVLAVNEVTGTVYSVSATGELSPISSTTAGTPVGARFCGVSRATTGLLAISTCEAPRQPVRVLTRLDSRQAPWAVVQLVTVPRFDSSNHAWALSAHNVLRVSLGSDSSPGRASRH
jgi:hypothetical protein